ncbi:transcriptional regulator, LuxR family protein [Catenovulum agarivorans DS-2]|uniref:Transcriptional regulator, LuxR family protein n=1 Tax=Catenovulum agarivorans DS-2 TaxID=1328313 RepID=W7QBD2_9ALTE|nr:helix-turn-helix transcriptional regulator [Catenovulum agarivorans]EWH09296.1 transcriptional regulator, LuxR family protein [Catenovulum agarivorans DS-2]
MLKGLQLLTQREKQVVELILKGYSNKKIANILYVSERTIKFHCSNIYAKCEVGNRNQLFSLLSPSVRIVV